MRLLRHLTGIAVALCHALRVQMLLQGHNELASGG